MKIILCSILIFFLSADFSQDISIKIKSDKTLIVPGYGAENIMLNQNTDDILAIKGYPDKISDVNSKMELFRDIYKINSPVKIIFDKIFYYDFGKTIFFLNSNLVSAIAGLSTQRVTIDSVDLNKGAEYFIFSYGNKNLEIIKKENESKDVIYCYTYGMAIVDDKGDDKIDMYIIYPTEQK